MLDEGIVRVTDREYQLAERAAPHVTLFGLHPELQNTHTHIHTYSHYRVKSHAVLSVLTSQDSISQSVGGRFTVSSLQGKRSIQAYAKGF